jgi:sulfite reductase (NADPH) flavoprotein alpha-component
MEEKNHQLVPCLPESAPFTPEQRAYLNGFLAGLFSRAPAPPTAAGASAPAPALVPLSILFGSQTGNAENLARRLACAAGQRGFAPTVHDLARYPRAQLASEDRVLLVTSTFGDGDPPDNARAFWEFICGPAAPKLPQMRFSICALGDSNYPKFCGFGKDVDARLEALGARRVVPRAECDVDFEEPFAKWCNEALGALSERSEPKGPPHHEPGSVGVSPAAQEHKEGADEKSSVTPHPGPFPFGRGEGEPPSASGLPTIPPLPRGGGEGRGEGAATNTHDRKNPFLAPLLVNQKLNAPASSKETRHFEIALEDSKLAYEVGDALGVLPCNCPELVQQMLEALKCSGEEVVPGPDGVEVPLREALLRHYEITKIPSSFLEAMADRSGDDLLKKMTSPGINGELDAFLWGREIIDLLLAHPAAHFAPNDFVGLLRKLQPRLYSISSSPKAHPARVHLTVSIVRYESLSRRRKGVCSTFLADRAALGVPTPIFVQTNKNFRPPVNGEAPMIMVGPGTGIAPFRAFIHERRAIGARGRTWLFFGEQHATTDFLYRDELETMLKDGSLSRLVTAFSRDQPEKIYVQHRLREHAREVFAWMEEGAHFYVCGDSRQMAKDADAALHEIIQTGGGRTDSQAVEYVQQLKATRRYQRDVY